MSKLLKQLTILGLIQQAVKCQCSCTVQESGKVTTDHGSNWNRIYSKILSLLENHPLPKPTKSGRYPSPHLWVILQTDKQTDRQTNRQSDHYIGSASVQRHQRIQVLTQLIWCTWNTSALLDSLVFLQTLDYTVCQWLLMSWQYM